MKIAQIAPLMESVPPRLYGGTERIVSYLTDELVRLGHEVTLFASADSITAAELVSCASTALRLDSNVRDPIPYYMLMLDRVRKLAEEFDILHFHIDQFHFPLFRQMADRTVTTLHGRQDLPDLKPLYIGFNDMPLVSISNDQRRPIAKANFVHTDIPEAPWWVVEGDDKKRARLNCIAHLLSVLPYEDVHQDKIDLGPRPADTGYTRPPRNLYHYVPDHAAALEK